MNFRILNEGTPFFVKEWAICVLVGTHEICEISFPSSIFFFFLLLFKSSSLSLESKWSHVAFISFSKVVFASLLKKEELDFISVAEAITWGLFLQVEPGLFPSQFFFTECCAWQITFATESSLFWFSFSFIVSLSLSSTSASYCLQEIDAFPGVQIVSILWISGDKKLRSRVSNDFIPFLQLTLC